MQPGFTSATAFDVAQIAFVTRRYEALRGLTQVALGGALLFSSVAMHFLYASTAYAAQDFNFSFLIAVYTAAILELELRYQGTFGRTQPPPFEFGALASWTPVWVLIGAIIDLVVADFARVQSPSAAAIGLAISSASVLLCDGRWRPYFLVPLCAAVAAIVITAAVPHGVPFPSYESDPLRVPVFTLAYALIGLGLITAGAFDHRLLAATLTPFHGQGAISIEARRRSSTPRTVCAAAVTGGALLTLCFPAHAMVLVLPSTLIVAFVAIGMRSSIRQWRRVVAPARLAPAEPFGLHPHTLIMFVLLAAAAVIDTALLGPAPIALTVVFALSSLWIVLRDWPLRRHYLLGAVMPLLLLPVAIRLGAAHAFTLLLFGCAAALMAESHLDGRGGESTLVRKA